MRNGRRERGFTLIELSVVIVISSLFIAAAGQVYATYLQSKHYYDTVSRLATVNSALSNYAGIVGRMPFPADPTLSLLGSLDSGCECGSCSATAAACAALVTAPFGCIGGICKVPGFRHTAANPNPNPAINDPVYIGTIPYKTMRQGDTTSTYKDSGLMNTMDSWNYQFGYAVSSGSTNTTSYQQGVYGVINVTTETGIGLTSPAGAANYVVISYGDNHMGAYTIDGIQPVPCTAGTVDFANCNGGATFVNGLRSMGAGATYYDDIIVYSAFSLTKLWDVTSPGSNDIYNLNVGGVGVGVPVGTSLTAKLQVNGTIGSATTVTGTQICDQTGAAANCWSPNLLAGPLTGTNASNNTCPPAPAGFVNVVNAFANGAVSCTQVPMVTAPTNQSCAAGHYAIGFSSVTGLVCN